MAYNDFTHLDAVVEATIADSASLSSAVNLGKMTLVSIQSTSDLEGAAYTFQGSLDGVTYANLYDEAGAEVNFPVSEARLVKITNAMYFHGLQWIKVRTGTAASATAQTGAITIKLGLVAI